MITEFENVSYDLPKTFVDITEDVQDFVRGCGADNGIVTVFSSNATACLKILENDVLSLLDVAEHLEKLIPEDALLIGDRLAFRGARPEEEFNACSNLRSLYFNHSETIPVQGGMMTLGGRQRIFAIELDPPRTRSMTFTYVGSGLGKRDEI